MRFLARFLEFFWCVCLWTVQHFVGHSAVAAPKHSVGHSLCSAECGGAQCRKPSQNSVGHSGREAPSFMRRTPSPARTARFPRIRVFVVRRTPCMPPPKRAPRCDNPAISTNTHCGHALTDWSSRKKNANCTVNSKILRLRI